MKSLKFLILAAVFPIFSVFTQTVFSEHLHQGWQQTFEVTNWLVKTQSPFQKIQVFENPLFGKVLVLDNIVQITEKDEFVYQEMLAHVPLFAHENPKQVLIIGGGDGAILKEVLKHKTVEKATLVDIDGLVMEISQKYLPMLSQGAFHNPRANVIVGDGIDFVKTTNQKFDVIIVDTTDPIGPGEVLFSKDFFAGCRRCLNKNGVLTIQNGVVFLQKEELKMTQKNLSPYFKNITFYLADVPTYIGGAMAMGFATNNTKYLKMKQKELENKISKNIQGKLKYYTPKIHKAAFALPAWVENYLAN